MTGDTPALVLDQLAESGAQSDRRFADSLLRHRVRQGYGLHRILAELRQRGIDDAVVDASGYDWDVVLEETHRKKYGVRRPVSPAERASRHRYLLQRGFSGEQIQHLFRRLYGQPDGFD